MISPDVHAQFARSCSEATLGYAAASRAACAAMTSSTLEFWSAQIKALTPQEEQPRSWYRHPDGPAAMRAATRPRTPAGLPLATANGGDPFAWYSAWLKLMASPRGAAAWPMAFGMMAMGVPHTVAVPAAEANAAALEAANLAFKACRG